MSDIKERLRAQCVGHPAAEVPWPHRVLHDALAEIERLEAENAKLRMAAVLADDIMAYCQGDAWERECTENDRKKFAAIYSELFKS